jgi:hypothetical protein
LVAIDCSGEGKTTLRQIMTDLNDSGIINDIDNNFIDIDIIPCFNDSIDRRLAPFKPANAPEKSTVTRSMAIRGPACPGDGF